MVPSAFVLLEHFPLTPNGKVDKKGLPAPDGSHLQGTYVAPESETEKALVIIWAKLLKLDADTISVTANFFELGGHSLIIIPLIKIAKNKYQLHFELKDLYEFSTIKQLAIQIVSKKVILEERGRSLVKLNNSIATQSLFIVHPGYGRADCYFGFAKLLSKQLRVFGLQAPCYYQREFRFTSLIQLAQYYADSIQSIQSTGPYKLAGWSSGGLLAYYVAFVLQERNEQVDYLSLFDSEAPNEHVKSEELIQSLELFFSFNLPDVRVSKILKIIKAEISEENILTKASRYLANLQIPFYDTVSENKIYLKAWVDFDRAERDNIDLNLKNPIQLIIASERVCAEEYIKNWEMISSCMINSTIVKGHHDNMMSGECMDEISSIVLENL